MNSDNEDDIMDPVMQCTTLPSHSGFSQKKLVSFVTEIHTLSIDISLRDLKMEILLEPTSNKLLVGSNTLSWKPCQGGSSKLNLPDHRYKRRCCSLIPAESDSLPHAHAQTTKTYYKHQDSRIKKAQVLKTKTSTNSDKQDLPLRYQVYQGRLLKSFQEDAKYEHVGRDTRSQGIGKRPKEFFIGIFCGEPKHESQVDSKDSDLVINFETPSELETESFKLELYWVETVCWWGFQCCVRVCGGGGGGGFSTSDPAIE
ncbi:hypothetical protein Tco_0675878 [Tanacetum coccineum]